MPSHRHPRQLAGKCPDLLDRMDRKVGMDREVVQGEAGDTGTSEGTYRQIRGVAGPDGMGTVHRRCDRHCSWVLQDTSRMDNGTSAHRKVRKVPGVESGVWADLVKYHKSI